MSTYPSATQSEGSGEGGSEAPPYLEIVWCSPCATVLSHPLLKAVVTIGRGDDCTIRLDDNRVSSRHAEIRHERRRVVIRDLASTNGTYVDGQRVESAPLAVGTILRIGNSVGALVRATTAEPRWEFGKIAPGLLGGRGLLTAIQPAQKTARTPLSILVEGESGTGKELVARAVHDWSGRSGDFVAVNCAAIPESLADGELFGYRRGAFTGALQASTGYLRAAHRGTLFLDEVADLPLELQPKLLRVLEQGEVPTLGQSSPVPVDLKVDALG